MPVLSYTHQAFWRSTLLIAAGLALAVSANAGKPDWAGKGHGKHGEDEPRSEHRQEPGGTVDIRVGGYFGDAQRRAAADYFGQEQTKGRCPPGLAKKNNGCLPPGQAKKWLRGQPLPRDVVFYPLPQPVSVRIGLPPSGYKYVRVAGDILLIAIGTNMVVDAMEDLMR